MSLTGKIAIVTGAARGIGEGCARALAREGASVVIADINGETAGATAASIAGETGVEAWAFAVDTSSQAQCQALADAVRERHGRADILVNSAGVARPEPSFEVTEADWTRLISINLSGTFFCCQALGRLMHDSGQGGVIINISSIAAETGWPERASYAASKAGVRSLTMSLAVEWAQYNIRVNAVGPSWVMTELMREPLAQGRLSEEKILARVPLHRFAEVREVADAVVFLASDKAAFITGQTLYVDGGFSAGAPAR